MGRRFNYQPWLLMLIQSYGWGGQPIGISGTAGDNPANQAELINHGDQLVQGGATLTGHQKRASFAEGVTPRRKREMLADHRQHRLLSFFRGAPTHRRIAQLPDPSAKLLAGGAAKQARGWRQRIRQWSCRR